VGIVDSAVDGGRFLLFARTIVGWPGTRPDIAKPAGSLYPQGIFDICEAFLSWHATIFDEFLGSMDATPPEPQPIVSGEDDQKWRWGGSAHRDGRELTVKLVKVDQDDFTFDATVSSTDGSALQSPVVFHLHHTFPKSRITITKVKDHRLAAVYGVESYGIFAIGVQVRNAAGKWIGLEFDLGSLEDLPRRFLSR
jgi:hypothetical protein